MAQMIPPLSTSLRRMKNAGERKVARLLQQMLEDDYLIWYDIPVGKHRRYPDFIVLHPTRGLMFLEVKDWKPSTLKQISHHSCTLLTDSGLKEVANPLEQVRQMAYQVVNDLLRNPRLHQQSERFKGQLACPYAWGAVFTNIRRDQMEKAIPQDVRDRLLPDHQMIYSDDLSETGDPEAFQQKLWNMFNVRFPCQLSLPQMDSIRWHLFPEIRIGEGLQTELPVSDAASDDLTKLPDIVRVMDIQQEVLARSLGEGHRVIHGVAGSGKTLILGYRCQYLASVLEQPILVLCFNITLAAKLRSFIAARGVADKVQIYHFHDWCGQQLRTYQVDVEEGPEEYFHRQVGSVIAGVEQGRIPRGQYGALMIDEGHDFEAEWLSLVVQMVDPDTNSLLLLYDDAQSIYKKRSTLGFSLSSVGIQAKGRTTVLRLNYRNSQEILEFAYHLVKPYMSETGNEEIPLIPPEAAGCSGQVPAVRHFDDLAGEITYLLRCLQHWAKQGRAWRDMAILYPGGDTGRLIAQALGRAGIPHAWLGSSEHKKRYDADKDQVAVMTVHSSKGLEFTTVVLVDASYTRDEEPETLAAQARLLYVGCTRAREHLVVSYHRQNTFANAFTQNPSA